MRSWIVLVVLGVCSTLGCKSDEPDASEAEPSLAAPEAEPPTKIPPIGAWVVIDEQQGMFKTANVDAGRIPSAPGSDVGPRLRVAEVVAIAGDFLEVRTIAGRPRVCATEVGVESDHELRFFVRFDALQPVLARAKHVEFEDGTKLELTPGVPVIETGERGMVRVDEVTLSVALADGDVGRWFVDAPLDLHGSGRGRVTWKPGLVLHYGEHEFTAHAEPFLSALDRRAIEGGQLLTFAHACGRFVLRSELEGPPDAGLYAMKGPADAIPQMARNFDPDMAARNAGILGVMQQEGGHFLASPYGEALAVGGDDDDVWGGLTACTPPTWTAAAGTTLSWLGGGEAGRVLAAHELPRVAEERGDRVCFKVSGLDVCIETAKLERKGDADCEPGGGLGFVGTSGDFQAGGFGGRGKRVPQIRQAKATVGEGLDRDIVRRIVRAHINELRSCYNAGLVRDPALAGRIEIAFVIGVEGKVASASVQASTLAPADDKVSACFAKAVKRWTFPKPRSGASVSVVYPFDLSPG